MRAFAAAPAAALLAAALLTAAPPAAADKQEGYYYPPVTSEEEFTRKLITGPEPTKSVRESFITLIVRAQLDAPSAPRFSLFAKGGRSRRLIMIGLDDDAFRTLYRARAVLAQLTYNLRGTAFFTNNDIADDGTFFDILQTLDFESLTVSDGESWSHRIYFK